MQSQNTMTLQSTITITKTSIITSTSWSIKPAKSAVNGINSLNGIMVHSHDHRILFNYDIIDQNTYQQYIQAVRSTLMQHSGKVLVSDSEPNDIEGKSNRTLVVLEFETEAAAMQWYNSPEYQAIIHLRIDASEGWGRRVPQFVMPAA